MFDSKLNAVATYCCNCKDTKEIPKTNTPAKKIFQRRRPAPPPSDKTD